MTSLQALQSYCQATVGNLVFLTCRLKEEYLTTGLSHTDLCRQGLRFSLWVLYSIFPPTPLYSKLSLYVSVILNKELLQADANT